MQANKCFRKFIAKLYEVQIIANNRGAMQHTGLHNNEYLLASDSSALCTFRQSFNTTAIKL